MWRMLRNVQVSLVASGLAFQMPLVWAQPLEVADPAEASREVAAQVDRLVAEVAARDPELAQEIERQQEICLRDIGDGRLDDTGLTHEIETYREVQGEIQGRVIQAEVEARVAELTAKGNSELAERMQSSFEAFRMVGGPGTEMISRGDARAMFEQAYQEAQRLDPEGAQHMKDMFEAAERGEFVRPTPETMDRMRQEMERYIAERPEMADYGREYAKAEFERYAEFGGDHERYGPTDTPEQARAAFERWSSESGASQADIDRMRTEMEKGMGEWERGMMEMEHGSMGEWERGVMMEMERNTADYERIAAEYERVANEWERDTSITLDQKIDTNPTPGTGTGETLVRTDNHDHLPDMPGGDHPHEIYRHGDGTCHDHGDGTPDTC